MKKLLLEFLSKTHKKAVEHFESMLFKEDSDELNDDAIDQLIELDKTRVEGFNAKLSEEKDKQYKRGVRETSEQWEKDIKETFGLTTENTGEELIAEVLALKPGTEGGEGGGDGEITDETVKAHPTYQALQKAKAESEKSIRSEYEEKLKAVENDYTAKSTRQIVNSVALQKMKGLNPILSEDTDKANKQLKNALRDLDGYTFVKDGDTYKVMDEEGKLVDDGHGNPVSFDDLIENVTKSNFDLGEGNGGGGKGTGTGNKNDPNRNKFKVGTIPKNGEELKAALRAETDESKREAIVEAYESRKADE